MMITLLAQLVAPTIQRGPIRLPGTDAGIERKVQKDSRTIIDKDSLEETSGKLSLSHQINLGKKILKRRKT